jgi:hypothetical protein
MGKDGSVTNVCKLISCSPQLLMNVQASMKVTEFSCSFKQILLDSQNNNAFKDCSSCIEIKHLTHMFLCTVDQSLLCLSNRTCCQMVNVHLSVEIPAADALREVF